MDHIIWLLLSYQVPVEPSKKRVYVWRKLKEMGAIYYRQGVAMLPKNPRSIVEFNKLAAKIEDMSGESSLAELKFLNKKDDNRAVSKFLKQSRTEYKKIIGEISQLYTQQPSSPEVAAQNAEKARKLERRLIKIKSRDYFMSLKEPEVLAPFSQLLKDMSFATDNLSSHISRIINDR